MTEHKIAAPNKVTTPKYMFTMSDMGFESSVKGFEAFSEIMEWGLDSHCYSSPQISGNFSQQDPPSSGPLYVRVPLGLQMPKLVKAMIIKQPIKKAQIVMLASIHNVNTIVMEINMESVMVEEVLLGNNIRGKSNKNMKNVDNNDDNTFEILLRFGKIEWLYNAFKQDGSKVGKDAAGLNLMTGEMM